MTCRRGICHAIQGAILGILIGHAITLALFPRHKSVGLRLMIRTSPESVHHAPAMGETAGTHSSIWDR